MGTPLEIVTEGRETEEDRQFSTWLSKVAKLLDCSAEEIDSAWDMYADGCDPEDAAQEIKSNM